MAFWFYPLGNMRDLLSYLALFLPCMANAFLSISPVALTKPLHMFMERLSP
jgi:hypothetical protein